MSGRASTPARAESRGGRGGRDADGKPRLTASARSALIPLSILSSVGLYYGVGIPLWTVALTVFLPVSALYLAAPWLARRSMAHLDREIVRLLARGERARLLGAYHRALLFRLFGEPPLVAERLGLVHAQLGQAKLAREAYERAADGWGGEPPISVTLGIANACYTLGDDEAAEPPYRELLRADHRLVVVLHNLAHGLVRKSAKNPASRAKAQLKEAVSLATEGLGVAAGGAHEKSLQLTLAEAHAALGDKKESRRILDELGELDGELGERLATVKARLSV